jgi:hypothetical protein
MISALSLDSWSFSPYKREAIGKIQCTKVADEPGEAGNDGV